MCPEVENRYPNKNVRNVRNDVNAHSSTMHHSQKAEITHMAISGQLCFILRMEYYSAMKGTEVCHHVNGT